MKPFGVELLIDMHECDETLFTEEHISRYFIELCDLIDMTRHGDPMFWIEYGEELHMSGISAVQFIRTSNIVVHTLDRLRAVYVNIFSCKVFDRKVAEDFTASFFKAGVVDSKMIDRV